MGQSRRRGERSGGRARAGFTLIELMLAITVLVVAMIAAVSSHVSSYNLLRTSSETNVAMADLRGAMEEILLKDIDSLPIAGSLYAQGQVIARYTNKELPNETIIATYPNWGGGTVPNPLQIVVTASWNDFAGRPRTLLLETIKGR